MLTCGVAERELQGTYWRQGKARSYLAFWSFMTSVLMAASDVAQLEGNLRSLDVSLAKELLKEIDALHEQVPNPR